MKRLSTFLILGIFALVAFGGYNVYLSWQSSKLVGEVAQADALLADYGKQVLEYEHKQVLESINAKKTINELKKEGIIEWSNVIKKIRVTIPKVDGTPIVTVLSYSGSSNDEISMNVKTTETSENPYFDVADLIKAFNLSEYFTDAFVPSISNGVDEKGNQVLTFLISMKYLPNSGDVSLSEAGFGTEDAGLETTAEPAAENIPKVSR
ncbi:hypothetical protein M0P48_04060 [Candidatus Gracilibacteria bacterium]|jgi:hypothetical protein|nr:hypothetical protein [Candidatus Gracilibacteria bacterium]